METTLIVSCRIKYRMGRYAFFNTGFEYKFWFAIQPSFDIAEFGGTDTTVDGAYSHKWSASSRDDIRKELELMAKFFDLKVPNFEKFPKTTNGTWALHCDHTDSWALCNRGGLDDFMAGKWALFKLGCLIYHQLLYKDELSCKYEV
jgi:hypothetical protein